MRVLRQITNQMITACKSYITNHGEDTLWTRPMAEVTQKMDECVRLNEQYQECFRRTKQRVQDAPAAGEPRFDFSEMYIFGKFDAFTRRLKKIAEMFETIAVYAHLQESKIEGINRARRDVSTVRPILSTNDPFDPVTCRQIRDRLTIQKVLICAQT